MTNLTVYQQRLNLQNCTFSRIVHNEAMVAVVYKITDQFGKQFILKICPRIGDYLRELYFLNYFAGLLPVPHIIKAVEPEKGLSGAILMEYLPGELLKITDFTETLAYEIGSLLAKIHLNRAIGYGDLTKPNSLSSDPRTYFSLKFEENFTECSNHLPKELLEECRRYYSIHLDLLTGVDGPCIIHRDFRPGNIIIHNGRVHGIIDWASGRASFADEDFCAMEHGEWSINSKSKDSLLAGYASIRPIPDYNKIMPLLRLNKALATIGFTVKNNSWQNVNARIYQFNRRFIETFF